MSGLRWVRLSAFVVAGTLLVSFWLVWVYQSPGVDVGVMESQLVCKDLARAAEAYRDHPANPRRQLPGRVRDLIHPPWGGPSLYRDGAREPRDAWGNPFQLERRQTPDGGEYFLVWTAKPDGTRISQFGVGPGAEPNW